MKTSNTLNRRVLKLNRSWTVVGEVSLRRAVHMCSSPYKAGPYMGEPKAKIIDVDFSMWTWEDWAKLKPKDEEAFIRTTTSGLIRVPEVIMVPTYDKTFNQTAKFSRNAIYKRDSYTCQYCGAQPGPGELSIDHVLPKSKGGLTTWENCVISCLKCNTRKADKTLAQAGLKLSKQPVRPKYTLLRTSPKVAPKSWRSFLSEAYWNVELQNDNV